jgi:DedD protein
LDDQLKQRLIGATIIVVLAVVFVPMLFDDKVDDRHDITASTIPPSPKELDEREIALPAMTDGEESETSESETSSAAAYRIIPLTDTPPASDAAREPPRERDQSAGLEQRTGETPIEFGEDEGGAPAEVPTRDSPLARTPRSPGGVPAVPVPGDKVKAAQAVKQPATPLQQEGRSTAGTSVAPASKAPSEKQLVSTRPVKTPTALPAAQAKPTTGSSARPVPTESLAVKQPESPRSDASRVPKTAKSVPQKITQTGAATPAPVVVRKAGPEKRASGEKTASIPSRSAKTVETTRPSSAQKAVESPKPSTPPKSGGTQAETKSEPVAKASDQARASLASPKAVQDSAQASKPATPKLSEAAKATATAAAVKKKPEVSTKTAMAPTQPATAGLSSKSAESVSPKQPMESKSGEPVNKPKSDTNPSAWVIQAGNFTSEAGAKALAEKLRKNKFTAFVETIPGQQGATYRVQVGPELEKDRAEQTQKRLESSVGIRGILKARR